MIKAIIFDLGGVCFDIDWLKINKEMVKKFNITTLVKSTGNERVVGYYKEALKGKKHIKEMFSELNKGNHDLDEITKFYKETYKKYKKHNKKVYELVKKLKEKFLVACLTDTNSIHFEAHVEQESIKEFHRIFTSFQIGSIKSETTTFKKIIKDLSLEPKEIVFIDDNKKNIEIAKSLGIKGIEYKNYEQLVTTLKKYISF